jgi:hypothetical protein
MTAWERAKIRGVRMIWFVVGTICCSVVELRLCHTYSLPVSLERHYVTQGSRALAALFSFSLFLFLLTLFHYLIQSIYARC